MIFAGIVSSAKKALGFPAEQKAYSLSDPALVELFGALPTASGVVVTSNSAMHVPAVLQAVRLISETLGSLPCKLYRETGDSKEAAKDHPAHKITHSRANDWTSAGQLRIDLTVDALLHGAGFAQVVRASDDRPLELHRLDPSKVQRQCEDDGEPYYLVSTERGQVRLSYRDVLHIPAFAGVSPVKLGREAIGIGLTLEKHTSNLFSDGARPSGMFWTENNVPDTDAGTKTISNIMRDWRAVFSGSKQNRPLFVPNGYRYQQMALASTDAQFIENRLEQINEVARIFGVPPHMLYQLERATWSNAEQMLTPTSPEVIELIEELRGLKFRAMIEPIAFWERETGQRLPLPRCIPIDGESPAEFQERSEHHRQVVLAAFYSGDFYSRQKAADRKKAFDAKEAREAIHVAGTGAGNDGRHARCRKGTCGTHQRIQASRD